MKYIKKNTRLLINHFKELLASLAESKHSHMADASRAVVIL